jgi:hypothetical protein
VLFVQPFLGYVHHVKFKRLLRRTWWSHTHLWVGRLAITLGIINGGFGLHLAAAPTGAVAGYSAIAGIIWLVWMFCAVSHEARRRRGERQAVLSKENSPPYTPFAPGGGSPDHHRLRRLAV